MNVVAGRILNDEALRVRMPTELRTKLESIAAFEGRSVADVIRRMLVQAVKEGKS